MTRIFKGLSELVLLWPIITVKEFIWNFDIYLMHTHVNGENDEITGLNVSDNHQIFDTEIKEKKSILICVTLY